MSINKVKKVVMKEYTESVVQSGEVLAHMGCGY